MVNKGSSSSDEGTVSLANKVIGGLANKMPGGLVNKEPAAQHCAPADKVAQHPPSKEGILQQQSCGISLVVFEVSALDWQYEAFVSPSVWV
jgi:hypothetical protein